MSDFLHSMTNSFDETLCTSNVWIVSKHNNIVIPTFEIKYLHLL